MCFAAAGGKRMFDIVMEHARDADVRKGGFALSPITRLGVQLFLTRLLPLLTHPQAS